jgi:hypothetical protein
MHWRRVNAPLLLRVTVLPPVAALWIPAAHSRAPKRVRLAVPDALRPHPAQAGEHGEQDRQWNRLVVTRRRATPKVIRRMRSNGADS